MRMDDLRYFLRVVEAGSISQAAQNNFITQQGLSRIISSLETELDVKLLQRGKALKLTPAGKAILNDARTIEEAYLRILDTSASMSNRWDGTRGNIYTIYATSVICATILSSIIATLNKRFPGMFFNVVERLPTEIISIEDPGPQSIAILSIPDFLIKEHGGLESEHYSFTPMFQDELRVGVAPDSPLAGQGSVAVEELSTYPLVIHNNEILMTNHLFGNNYTPDRLTHTTNHGLCRRMVLQGRTVGLTSRLVQYASHDEVLSIPLDCQIIFHYGCIRWGNEDPFIEEIFKTIQEAFLQVYRWTGER